MRRARRFSGSFHPGGPPDRPTTTQHDEFTQGRRLVFAVGADGTWQWPPEVSVLFATEWEAQRHAAAAAYGFQVFAMPVYPTYDDCPSFLRFVAPVTGRISQPFAQEVAEYRRRLRRIWPGPYGPPDDQPIPSGVPIPDAQVVYAVGSQEEGSPEVYVLFETPEAAEQHVARSYYRSFALPVYAKYEDCPPEKRYLQRGEPLSQLIGPRP